MIHEQTQETWNCGKRIVAAAAARLPQIESVCRAIHARHEVAGGRSFNARAKRGRKRGYKPFSEADGYQGLDKSRKPVGGCSGATGMRFAEYDAARFKARLQSVRPDPVPARLRPEKARRAAGIVSADGLHGGRIDPCKSADRDPAGTLAEGPKIKNGIPATEQSPRGLFRHGTKSIGENAEIADFVPPRNKTPCFSGGLCSATGHLYRLAICRGVLCPL